MNDAQTLRNRLVAELENATAAAVMAAAAVRARPIAESGATDATGVLAAVARVAYYYQQYDAGARTVAELTMPADWPLPTAHTVAERLLQHPESLPLAAAVAEAAQLTPDDAHTDHERAAHRAAERWLCDFAPVLPGNREPSAPLPVAVLFLSDLVVAYLAAGRPRGPLYDLVSLDAVRARRPPSWRRWLRRLAAATVRKIVAKLVDRGFDWGFDWINELFTTRRAPAASAATSA